MCSSLLSDASVTDKARIRVARSKSGAWLHAVPSPKLSALLDDDISVALRLRNKMCEPHRFVYGAMVEND